MPGAYDQKSIESHFTQSNKRLHEIEAQLAVLSEKLGIAYEPSTADVPEDVVELAQAGKTLEAMNRYRELTNATADEAREIVQGL